MAWVYIVQSCRKEEKLSHRRIAEFLGFDTEKWVVGVEDVFDTEIKAKESILKMIETDYKNSEYRRFNGLTTRYYQPTDRDLYEGSLVKSYEYVNVDNVRIIYGYRYSRRFVR